LGKSRIGPAVDGRAAIGDFAACSGLHLVQAWS
jgi:hypothetical protein